MPYRLCVIHAFDPRGAKVGGLETFIRDMIAFLPDDFTFLMVGVDARGDLKLGRISEVEVRGRPIRFLPLIYYPDDEAREAARSIRQSLTFQFMQGLLRNLQTVRRVLKQCPTSVDLQRVEYAGVVRGLGVPFIQMLHGEGAPRLKMDSLLKNYRFVHNINERLAVMAADKFLCVNPIITERIRQTYPRYAHKIDTLSTWVDTRTFHPTPFPDAEPLRIAFAGRLDLFKSPPLMFKTIARLRDLLPGGVELHYMGTSDPYRFTEFAAIEDVTTRHGFKTAQGVAEVWRHCHAGILTSEFEGMPFAILEALGCGRPVCAIHLPQLECVIQEGLSGTLVSRSTNEDDMAERLSQAFLAVREDIRNGRLTPEGVASAIRDFTPERQLAKCYENHRQIQQRKFGSDVQNVSVRTGQDGETIGQP